MTSPPSPLLSAGIVVVRCRNGRWHYLLLRVGRYWDFPKGLLEAGEEPLAAACRETAEETGLTGLAFPWDHDWRDTPPYGRGPKVARYYLAHSPRGGVDLPVNPALGHPEHDAFAWLTYDAARPLLVERVQAILDWAHARVGPTCP